MGDKKLLDPLIADLIALSHECKRKFSPIKEAAEACQLKVRSCGIKSSNILEQVKLISSEIIQPFLMGCDTKNNKVVLLSLMAIQRLISQQILDEVSCSHLVNTLWSLMESRTEELKLLQTAILLINTNSFVKHESLAKALALCFRIYYVKDSTITSNTASATIRQLVIAVFDRVVIEDQNMKKEEFVDQNSSLSELRSGSKLVPKSLRPCAADAFMLFQDLCQLLNNEHPLWLLGMTEITVALCLELVENVLSSYQTLFFKHEEFKFLLSEKTCPLIIKLFSPSLKFRSSRFSQTFQPSSNSLTNNSSPKISQNSTEKPNFSIVVRLLRIVSVLIQCYSNILFTESEIFLSLLVKFLDPEKFAWQRLAALEVLQKMCLKPLLLKNFCEFYDMIDNSTKIVNEIINGIGVFINSQFSPQAQTSFSATGSNSLKNSGDTITPIIVQNSPSFAYNQTRALFVFRGVTIPLVLNVKSNHCSHKSLILETLDKMEPPILPEGYPLSLAFLCILEVVRSIHTIINPKNNSESNKPKNENDEKKVKSKELLIKQELISCTWCGVLSAFLLLLEASQEDIITEEILDSLYIFTCMSAQVNLPQARDSCVAALCKASLPAHYNLPILSSLGVATTGEKTTPRSSSNQNELDSTNDSSPSLTSQVVVVGNALNNPLSCGIAPQGSVLLTSKNIKSLKVLLNLAQSHGGSLRESWWQLLTTLQHLVWIMGLRPSSSGTYKVSQAPSDNNIVTTSFTNDLNFISNQLSQIFYSSKKLDDESLRHLIGALCKISSQSLDTGYTNKEPSLFGVTKLLETGLMNLSRVDVVWDPIISHLLEACKHPHSQMRMWASESVTNLVKSALGHHLPLKDMQLQVKLLNPLKNLISVVHADVKQKQLETTLDLIQTHGEHLLGNAWDMLLSIVGSVAKQGEIQVRCAFQSLQLIITDFLLALSPGQLIDCLLVVTMFGQQTQDLNISLTAVGLLWNIADHLSQNKLKITNQLVSNTGSHPIPLYSSELISFLNLKEIYDHFQSFDSLWVNLYIYLSVLCVDHRPAVRKSAGQTLFSMIDAHGYMLQLTTWENVFLKVLFPLLENVKGCVLNHDLIKNEISSHKTQNSPHNAAPSSILMHHSRDTVEKQWAETSFLTLSGIVKVASDKRKILNSIENLHDGWALLLKHICEHALSKNAEVASNALKSFQYLLDIKCLENNEKIKNGSISSEEEKLKFLTDEAVIKININQEMLYPSFKNDFPENSRKIENFFNESPENSKLWKNAWDVWKEIGLNSTTPSLQENIKPVYVPSQAYLTDLIYTFSGLYGHIHPFFQPSDLKDLFNIFRKALSIPVTNSSSSFFISSSETPMTPLQEAVIQAIKLLGMSSVCIKNQTRFFSKVEHTYEEYEYNVMYCEIILKMLPFIELCVHTSKLEEESGWLQIKNISAAKKFESTHQITFSEVIIKLTLTFYGVAVAQKEVIRAGVAQKIIKALELPLFRRYTCPSKTSWVLAITSLLDMLKFSIPIAKKYEAEFKEMWIELGNAFENFLFSVHPNPVMLSIEEFEKDEKIDCYVIHTLRDDILPCCSKLPSSFICKVMNILNMGSIHTISSSCFLETDSTNKLKEKFAKTCFETLLQFSFSQSDFNKKNTESSMVNSIAIQALLERCRNVLTRYTHDIKNFGNFPLPRAQMSEVSIILQAITTLLGALKKFPSMIGKNLWFETLNLYPLLVDCISLSSASTDHTSSSCPTNSNLSLSLKEALLQYSDLLTPPNV